MKIDLKNDIDYCTSVLSSGNIQETKNLYLQLKGKYSYLMGFPKINENPLFLSHYPNTYVDYLLQIKGFLEGELSKKQKDENLDSDIKTKNFSKVFLVHGHDGELKQEVARIIENQRIEAIILHEQTNQGATIIEKIEKHSNVGAAVCLLTPDDFGKAKNEDELKSRARQNVIFEAGLFIGKLGRNNIVFIADSDVEIPSDLEGIVYANSTNWKIDLLKELKAMGYNIDLNLLIKG